MSSGRLKACGNSLFLKARYGVGYRLGLMLKHGGEDVIAGDRFVLAFFFDEALCQAAETGATDVLYTSLVVLFVLVPLLCWVACFADFEEDSAKEKVA